MKRLSALLLSLLLSSAAVADNYGGFNAGPVSVNPTVTAGAYSANNAIGGLQTIPLFRTRGQPSGILDYVSVASKGGVTASIVLFAFTAQPSSTCTDNVAFSFNSNDLPYLVPGFPLTLTPVAAAGTTQTFASSAIPVSAGNQDSPVTTSLYVCAVTTGTPSPATTKDLWFTYALVRD